MSVIKVKEYEQLAGVEKQRATRTKLRRHYRNAQTQFRRLAQRHGPRGRLVALNKKKSEFLKKFDHLRHPLSYHLFIFLPHSLHGVSFAKLASTAERAARPPQTEIVK